MAAQIQALPQVRVVAPVAAGSGLAVRGTANRGIALTGIDPALYYRIVDLSDKIVRGSARLTGSDILIGTELASYTKKLAAMKKLLLKRNGKALEKLFDEARDAREAWLQKTWAGRKPGA